MSVPFDAPGATHHRFSRLDDTAGYSYEEFAQACAEAPVGPLTGLWLSRHDLDGRWFPRLYPVAVIDTGKEVFVRSLPGTSQHLTMRLTSDFVYDLSGTVAIHRPRTRSGDWQGAAFHEHIRFRTPERPDHRTAWLKGEWQRHDMLPQLKSVRRGTYGERREPQLVGYTAIGEHPERAWHLQRLTTTLDRAVLDEYIEMPPTSGPADFAGPLMPLDVALSCILFPDAGAAWRAAAVQAARLLARSWGPLEQDEYAPDHLACVALTVHMLANERIESPASIPVKVVRGTLREAVKQLARSDKGEPDELTCRIDKALCFTGLRSTRRAATQDATDRNSLSELFESLTRPDRHLGTDRIGDPPDPSPMARLLPQVVRGLSGSTTSNSARPRHRPAR